MLGSLLKQIVSGMEKMPREYRMPFKSRKYRWWMRTATCSVLYCAMLGSANYDRKTGSPRYDTIIKYSAGASKRLSNSLAHHAELCCAALG